jgi:hypothetical protein
MEKIRRELTDEETQSIRNGDGINEGIYSLTYEEYCMEDVHDEYVGYLKYLVERYSTDEENLRRIPNKLIDLIGNDSYEDILDLICRQKLQLNQNIIDYWSAYDDMNQSSKPLIMLK